MNTKGSLQINAKNKMLLLEALGELMYKVAIELQQLKGQPLTRKRKELTKKQKQLEALQHQISTMEITK